MRLDVEKKMSERKERRKRKMRKVGEEHEGNKGNKSQKSEVSITGCSDCVSSRLTATQHYTPKFLKTFEDKLIMVKQNCRPSVLAELFGNSHC